MRVLTCVILAVALFATPAFAKGGGHSGPSRGGSGGSMQTTKPKPTIDASKLKLRCYHTRGPNSLGIYVHRTVCG
jgi:hypothetical protein